MGMGSWDGGGLKAIHGTCLQDAIQEKMYRRYGHGHGWADLWSWVMCDTEGRWRSLEMQLRLGHHGPWTIVDHGGRGPLGSPLGGATITVFVNMLLQY